MDSNLKIPLQISLAIHLAILFSFQSRKYHAIRVPISVELMHVASQQSALDQAPKAPEPVQEKKEVAPQKKAKDDKSINMKKTNVKQKPKPAAQNTQNKSQGNGGQQGSSVRASSSITIEGGDFPFAYYLKILQGRIASNWEWPSQNGSLKSVLYFRIQRNGVISDVSVKETSGDYLYDQAAKRSVLLASPMTPLPEAYTDEYLGVFFEFKFQE